jgi:hypothetical protein
MRVHQIALTEVVPLPIDQTLRAAVKGLGGELSCMCAVRAIAFGKIMCPHGRGPCDVATVDEDVSSFTSRLDPIDPHSLAFADALDDPMPNGMSREKGLFIVLQRRPGKLVEVYEEALAGMGDSDARKAAYALQVMEALPRVVGLLAKNEPFRVFCAEHRITKKLKRFGRICPTAEQMHLALAS